MNAAHSRTHHQTPNTDPVRLSPPCRRRKSLRHRFCDGIEAAVKADPDAFTATRPRTMMGQIVQKLVCRAGDGRCDAVRLVVFFLDEGERRRVAAEQAAMGQSQGISEAAPAPEPEWDWDEEGGWDSSGREASGEDQRREDEASAAKTEALRAELREKFLRAAEADRINAERKARLEARREGRNAIVGPQAGTSSGDIQPVAAEDRCVDAIRAGGRLVEA
jgi:hypothetical protein